MGALRVAIAICTLGGVLSGCAALELPAPGAGERAEPVYRTGSRIPARDGAQPVGAQSAEDWKASRREGATSAYDTTK